MKPLRPDWKKRIASGLLLSSVLQCLPGGQAQAQLPDCVSGTVMYAAFNDSIGSTAANPSEIRAVNYATGAVGPLMGGTTYTIRRRHTASGVWYYGTSSLGVDVVTNRFYVNTQMASNRPMPKDIYSINTLTATMVRIGATPAGLDDYHIVKMAVSPLGMGYMVGVHRTESSAGATFNPLIRFTTCGGAPTIGCSTVELLGYLPDVPVSTKWQLFNGDIAFDNAGNMYYATAGYENVGGGVYKYANARLFRINAADIPAVAGTGVIPMTLLSDYDGLDSTVVNGMAVDPAGAMYFTTRTFNGPTNPSPPFTNRLFRSAVMGTVSEITTFGPITTGYAPADLASCYFPLTVLPDVKIELNGKYSSGATKLNWKVNNNNKGIRYFEIQRSEDYTNNYVTVGTVMPMNTDQASQSYTFTDEGQEFGKKRFYRIREVLNDGRGLYSNVLIVQNSELMSISVKPRPNPFINEVDLVLKLQANSPVEARIIDASGRLAFRQQYSGIKGENRISIQGLATLKPGIYFLDVAAGGEILHEKIVKQ